VAAYRHAAEHPVLEDISIEVAAGEIVGLLGPNGFGKSSTLKALCGSLPIMSGRVWFNKWDITGESPEKIASMGVRCFPQGGHVFSDLSVEDNLKVAAACVPRPGADPRHAYEWFADLAPRARTRAGLLSGGQRQMLSLSMVLIYMYAPSPVVFLLDEPSGSLDPSHRQRLAEVIRHAREDHHVGVLVAEENAAFAKEICDHFYSFTEPGRVQALDPARPRRPGQDDENDVHGDPQKRESVED
jgi:branched-chain amino acid transport system ATP-binding protein